jgi:diguanylate cyclase (GGDEF)-like protein
MEVTQQMSELTQFLNTVEIFKDLGEDERTQLTGMLEMGTAETGEVLFEEGDTGEKLYIVRSGSIASSVTLSNGERLEVATFGPGDFFGEMSIFDQAPRSATCHAKEDTMLLALRSEAFDRLMSSRPDTAIKTMYKMLTITTQRLENTSEFVSDMVQFGEEARKRAVTDPATGLFNRGFLDSALQEQYRKAKQQNMPLCLVMADLDHFNSINEAYGQEVGDEVIHAVVPILKDHFRDSDILARYGGDEFTFVLPNTDARTAHELCARVREAVVELDVLHGRGGSIEQVTTSQGIACFPEHAEDIASLREQADQALYRAKELGRNRTVVVGEQ